MTEILDSLTDEDELEAARQLRAHRARAALNQAAGLAAHMRAHVLHTDGRTEAGTWLPEAKTPLSSVKTDDADDLYARIIEWVRYWAAEIDPTGKLPKGWTRIDQDSPASNPDVQILGFRAGTNAPLAHLLVNAQTSWLLRHDEQIGAHPTAEVYQLDVNKMIWDYRARYGLTRARERDVRQAECPVCHQAAVSAIWHGEKLTDVVISCDYCGHLIDNPTPTKIIRWISTEGAPAPFSEACEAGEHRDCTSVNCVCPCHLPPESVWGDDVEPSTRTGRPTPFPASTAVADQRVCPNCWLYHAEGACDA